MTARPVRSVPNAAGEPAASPSKQLAGFTPGTTPPLPNWPVPRASDCVVSLAVSPKGVALSFYQGASLPDPRGVLLGSGKQNRYVRLVSAATLSEPAVEGLIRAAIAQAKTPLAATGRGRLVIKSISAKQRPRRT